MIHTDTLAVLTGLATGTVFGAAVALLAQEWSAAGVITRPSLWAGLLLAWAASVYVPHAIAWRFMKHPPVHPIRASARAKPRSADRRGAAGSPSSWMSLASVLLAAAVAMAALPTAAVLAGAVRGWWMERFLWSFGTRGILDASAAGAAGLAALLPLGLAFAWVQRSGPQGYGWSPRTTGWWLVGAACGAMWGGAQWLPNPEVRVLSAALPALLGALLSAIRAPAARDADWRSARLPVRADPMTAAGRVPSAFMLAWAAAGGITLVAIPPSTEAGLSGAWGDPSPPVMVAIMGAGMVLGGSWSVRSRLMGALGLASGMVLVGALLTAEFPPASGLLWLVAGLMTAATYAAAQRMRLDEAPDRYRHGVRGSARLALAAVVGAALLIPFVTPRVGREILVAVPAVGMCLGGALSLATGRRAARGES